MHLLEKAALLDRLRRARKAAQAMKDPRGAIRDDLH
jgi:hypothetical protein